MIRSALQWLLLIGLLAVPSLSLAVLSTLPSSTEVENRLQRLKSDPTTNQAAIAKLEQTLESLAQLNQWQNQLSALNQTINALHNENKQANKQLAQLQQAQAKTVENIFDEAILQRRLAEAKTAASDIAATNTQLQQQRQILLKSQQQLPSQISQTEQTIKTLQAQPSTTDIIDEWYIGTQLAAQQARLALLNLQQSSLVSRQENNKLLLEVGGLRQKLNDQQINLVQQQLLTVSEKSGKQMISSAELLVKRFQKSPTLLKAQAEKILTLAKKFDELGIETVKAQQQRQRLNGIRLQISQTLVQLKENIQWLQRSPAFSDAIRTQLKRLPNLETDINYTQQLSDAHLNRFMLSQRVASIKEIDDYSQKQPGFDELNRQQKEELTELLKRKLELLNQILNDQDQYIAVITEVDALQVQVSEELASEKAFLREKQLFLQGRPAVWNLLPQSPQVFLGLKHWPIRQQEIWQQLQKHEKQINWFIVFLLLLVPLHFRLKKIERRILEHYQPLVGKILKDRFYLTFNTIALACLNVFVSISWLLVPLVWSVFSQPYADSYDLFHVLLSLVFIVASWELLIHFCYDNGLFIIHFRWSLSGVISLRKLLLRYRWWLYVSLLFIVLFEFLSEETESTALRCSFTVFCLLQSLFYFNLSRNDAFWHDLMDKLPSLARPLLSLLLIMSMLAAASLSLWGFFYAGWSVVYYLNAVLAILIFTLLLRQCGFRWLRVEQQKLQYQQILQRRQADDDSALLSAEQTAQINDQSLLVVNMLSLLIGVGILSALIANTSLAFQWTDNVELWSVVVGSGNNAKNEIITLNSALLAVTVLFICLFAASNVPGAVQLLILQHLNLSNGTGYAITTLLRYLFFVGGFLFSLSTLGLQWSKLQWLVAAIGVGLGFGLQEIFANLVSGLILLFERPVRVGDIITINNLTGTVQRINTRATTITDWDHREIVVPNKSLITDKLINWSLSDGITRIILPIGIAYGSDIQLAKTLLLKAALEHPDVLKHPAPLAFFTNFGDSCLECELRVYLDKLERMSIVRDELNCTIDAWYREHEIEIAFPQMDVHVRSNEATDLPPDQGRFPSLTEDDLTIEPSNDSATKNKKNRDIKDGPESNLSSD